MEHKKTVSHIAIAFLFLLIVATNGYQYFYILNLEKSTEEIRKKYDSRLILLESKVSKRDQADPLQAKECAIFEGQGDSRKSPCHVEFHRLYEAPHQFDGKWIRIVGYWIGGFEKSALIPRSDRKMFNEYSPNNRKSDWMSYAQYGKSLWVDFAEDAKIPKDDVISKTEYVFVGKFHRGPAGHLDQYFGEISGAQIRVH